MPHLNFNYTLSNHSDGHGTGAKLLLDITASLSELYGKQIRQGSIVKINSIRVGVANPNTSVQDESLSAAGTLQYFHPTGNRKKAWKNAFDAVLQQRKQNGIKTRGYDFRVGFYGTSGWDTVINQAWIRSEDDVLVLGASSDDQNSVFEVYNDSLIDASYPVNSDLNGFGTPYDTPGLTQGDLDFEANEATFYQLGKASYVTSDLTFQAAAGGIYDAGVFQSGGDMAPAWTNTDVIDGPIWVMCGLMGLDVSTTIPDDTTNQTQDTLVTICIDVESWKPILPRRKKGRKSRGKRSRR